MHTDELLTPAELAPIFGVDPSTVFRWASSRRVPSVRTADGRVAFRTEDVRALLSPAHHDLLLRVHSAS